jgi:hypothetical protein
LGCKCTAEEVGVNCTPEGGTPTVGKPCCDGTFSFQYPYGSTCIKDGTDPYKNCVSSGTPGPGQTCCAGYELGTNGSCTIKVSAFDPTCQGTGISTAIGCIHVLDTPEAFLSDILKWAVGIGAGIAFLLMLYAGFMIMTASGSPERLKAGQELLTSALAGLILLIFSIFILKFIGVDILGLGKFGFGGS